MGDEHRPVNASPAARRQSMPHRLAGQATQCLVDADDGVLVVQEGGQVVVVTVDHPDSVAAGVPGALPLWTTGGTVRPGVEN